MQLKSIVRIGACCNLLSPSLRLRAPPPTGLRLVGFWPARDVCKYWRIYFCVMGTARGGHEIAREADVCT